jgi:plasmid stabilization system protein ParE
MSSYKLAISPDALASMDDQMVWYEKEVPDGETLADKWLVRITLSFQQLLEHPTRFSPAPENRQWQQAILVRQMLFRPWKSGVGWRVLFSVDEASAIITVLQIRHESRPWLEDDKEAGAS